VTAIDWFSLLHPVLVILFVYPVVGATIRLGILVREKRLGITQQPAPVPREHADHGRWLTAGVVVSVLIALVYSFVSKAVDPAVAFTGGLPRLVLLMLVAAGTLVALLALLKVKQPALRASFTLLTWAGLLGLGSQAEIWRLSDDPLTGAFWSSHYWSGVLLTGLFLMNLAARPEISRHKGWRRLHVSSNILIMVLLAVQAITGSRDLLEIPLSWQKPAIYRCDFTNRVCPEPVAVPAAAAPGLGAAAGALG
jgi:hypothetical protein